MNNNQEWLNISNNLAKGLRVVREIWFDNALNLINAYFAEEGYIKLNLSYSDFINSELEYSLKAFQLLKVSECIVQNQCIPIDEGKNFADILYSLVFGEYLDEGMQIFERYYSINADKEKQVYLFHSDMARLIIEEDEVLVETALLATSYEMLMELIQVAVARGFNDDELVERILKS